jgi:predicted RNA-binding Zn-ribbon protein involved in translation (DUF1610 family)
MLQPPGISGSKVSNHVIPFTQSSSSSFLELLDTETGYIPVSKEQRLVTARIPVIDTKKLANISEHEANFHCSACGEAVLWEDEYCTRSLRNPANTR